MPTPHNEAKLGEIAKTVIMPGDPLRAKVIAEKYLENTKLVNSLRGMYAYTGTYKGKEITVMAHGMGMPSAGIYVYELFKFYEVEKIIRIGSCGSLDKDIKILDVFLVEQSYTESNYAYQLNNTEPVQYVKSSDELNKKIKETANANNINLLTGNAITVDVFDWYMNDKKAFYERVPKEAKPLVAEMESFAILYIAKMLQKEATCLLTVVDSEYQLKEVVSADDRQNSMDNMILLALESSLK